MDLNIQTYLIVCPLVFMAGLVDSIAGGGGLISLPAYMLAGIPIHQSIATNKLSSGVGTIVSTIRFWKNRYMDLFFALPSVIVALIGSAIGANLSLMVSEQILRYLLAVILPITAFYVLKKKSFDDTEIQSLSRNKACLLAVIISFVVGGYDGFYGPGTGTFLLLLYTGVAKIDLKTASGNTKLVNLSSNLSALIIFIMNGKILFMLGAAAALFSIAGHYIGAGLVMKKGYKIVRPIILFVLVLLFVKIVSGV